MLPYHKILISGAQGKLGSAICTKLRSVCQIIKHTKQDDLSAMLALHRPDLIIDVTSHICIHEHIAIYQKHAILHHKVFGGVPDIRSLPLVVISCAY